MSVAMPAPTSTTPLFTLDPKSWLPAKWSVAPMDTSNEPVPKPPAARSRRPLKTSTAPLLSKITLMETVPVPVDLVTVPALKNADGPPGPCKSCTSP